jgi:predicted membrane metal-binding protein
VRVSVYSLALSVLLGVVGYLYGAPYNLVTPLVLLGIVSLLLARRIGSCRMVGVFILLASVSFGASYTGLRVQAILDQAPPVDVLKGAVEANILVLDLPVFEPAGQTRPQRWQFQARVIPTEATGPRFKPFDASLSWLGADIPARLARGDRYSAEFRLRPASGPVNFTGFDFETWMLENRLQATGSVKSAVSVEDGVDANLADTFTTAVDGLRYSIRTAIFNTLSEEPFAPIMAGLVVGDQRSIPREQWQVFSVTGVSHLMSIEYK